MSNSCCAAPVLFSRRPDASSIAVAPPWNYCSVPGSPRKSPRGPPAESTEADEAARVLRDVLAVAARARYSEWAGANAAGSSSLRPEAAVHPALYFPRIRQRELELASEWAGADKVKSARERVEDEVREAADRFSTRSCYPLFGPPVRNVCFSYTWGYDYRRREQSKEISGTASSLRTRPRTQAERINASAADAARTEAISGERPMAGRAGLVPGGNLLSGRGSPAHLSPRQRLEREEGFNPVSPGQSPRWPRPPPTAAGTEPYIPHPSPPRAPVEWSLRSTGQLPPAPVPPKSYRRSALPSPQGPAALRSC